MARLQHAPSTERPNAPAALVETGANEEGERRGTGLGSDVSSKHQSKRATRHGPTPSLLTQ